MSLVFFRWLCGALLVAAVVAFSAPLVAWVVMGHLDALAATQAAAAGLICWLAAVAALATTLLGAHWGWPVQAMLASTLLRMGIPLTGVVLSPYFGGVWASRSWAGTLLGVYLVALAAETLVAVRMVPDCRRQLAAAGGVPDGMKVL
jgi:hypothetical protein